MTGFVEYVAQNVAKLSFYAQQHFLLVLYAVGSATATAVALGVLLHTNDLTPRSWRRQLRAGSRESALLIASAALTIPSMALFGILQPALGLGVTQGVAGGFGTGGRRPGAPTPRAGLHRRTLILADHRDPPRPAARSGNDGLPTGPSMV